VRLALVAERGRVRRSVVDGEEAPPAVSWYQLWNSVAALPVWPLPYVVRVPFVGSPA
jgi:hypothetical protein